MLVTDRSVYRNAITIVLYRSFYSVCQGIAQRPYRYHNDEITEILFRKDFFIQFVTNPK